jgi:secreted trypsin-like serine protease
MTKKYLRTLALGAAALGLASPALAQKTASGTFNGVTWEAQSRIVGQTSTGGANGGGDPLYFGNNGAYKGVVSLIMDYGAGGRFICSGSMIGARHIATAAHCVSSGAGTANPLKTTAYFLESGDPNNRYHSDGTAVTRNVTRYFVNSGYTGEVIDQNDIAILAIGDDAPDFATIYDIATLTDLKGADFNVAGFGGRSDIGGSFGNNSRTGYLRQGDNSYSYRWGDAAFNGFFTERRYPGNENFFGSAEVEYSYVSDFDNGNAANDTACLIAAAVGAPGTGCNTGRGASEVGVAGGDSGGPQFVNGKLSSVTSYGLTFGAAFGDCRAGLNSSCGEFNGFVPLYIHGDFIAESLAAAVPEPATWAMMIMGFGFVGAGMRARTRKVVLA